MINQFFVLIATVALALSTSNAFAHDPAEHAKEAAAAKAGPDCAQMATMDHSRMDPDDPVMQAMLAKCGKGKDPEHTDAMSMDHDDMDMAGTDHTAPAKPDEHGGQ